MFLVKSPIAVLSEFTDEDEVLARANNTEVSRFRAMILPPFLCSFQLLTGSPLQYGLYASVYTKDIQRALRLAVKLESGTVAINCTSPVMAFDIAFGGQKSSGDGRQFGHEGLESWLEVSRPLPCIATPIVLHSRQEQC